MIYTGDRPYADPDVAARKLVEIANTVEAVQDGRIYIELINAPFLKLASPSEYGAGLKRAIEDAAVSAREQDFRAVYAGSAVFGFASHFREKQNTEGNTWKNTRTFRKRSHFEAVPFLLVRNARRPLRLITVISLGCSAGGWRYDRARSRRGPLPAGLSPSSSRLEQDGD